ncbi:MAG: glycine cleavage system protein T [Lentisphaeria bacterium]|nr:glycine cleavage system protein T [Lentisphaeria bacterium]
MSALKTTPLTEYQIELGAKMVPHAGWNVPLYYPDGIIAEHRHTRAFSSVFDSCASGKIRVAGPGAAAALDNLFARPVADLETGRCRRNLLLSETGGILDCPLLVRMAEEDFLLLTDAGSSAGDLAWISGRLAGREAEAQELTQLLAQLDLEGPKSREVLEAIGVRDLPEYGCCSTLGVDGFRAIAVHAGSTGEDGFSLLFNLEYADQLWDLLLETEPVMPAGIGARDSLRLEMGYPACGHELTQEFTPAECALGMLLHPEEPREFIGKGALGSRFPDKRLHGVLLEGRRAAREGTLVLNGNDEVIGVVTSGCFCPSLDAAAALCRLEEACVKVDEPVYFEVTGAKLPGSLVALPFYDGGSAEGDWWLP